MKPDSFSLMDLVIDFICSKQLGSLGNYKQLGKAIYFYSGSSMMELHTKYLILETYFYASVYLTQK